MAKSFWLYILVTLLLTTLDAIGDDRPSRALPKIVTRTIMDTEVNIIGQKIIYPSGVAHITSEVIEIPAKTAVPWHEHYVPMYAFILEGSLDVDYGTQGIKHLNKGDAIIEAVNFPHKGSNNSTRITKVLVVYMGANGMQREKIIDKN